MINHLYKKIKSNKFEVVSMCHEIDEIEAETPSKVKVVLDKNQNSLYFSSAKITYGGSNFYCHKGIYGFKKETLKKIRNLNSSFLENIQNRTKT